MSEHVYRFSSTKEIRKDMGKIGTNEKYSKGTKCCPKGASSRDKIPQVQKAWDGSRTEYATCEWIGQPTLPTANPRVVVVLAAKRDVVAVL